MTLELLIVVLAGIAIALLISGFYAISVRHKTLLTSRVTAYADIEKEAAAAGGGPEAFGLGEGRSIIGRHYMEQLSRDLAQADLPLRPMEFIALRAVVGGLGFLVGHFVLGYTHSGLVLGLLGLFAPVMFVRFHHNRRRAKFARQLADALMLLVSSLRSGYSFLKGLELVASEMDDPISKELKRVLREVQLGSTVDQALMSLAGRVSNPDLEIVVGAYLVQRDVGGNLTELMEKVAETIRERLRIQADVRVLTAQGRMAGVVVAMIPFTIFGTIMLTNPGYFAVLLEPPMLNLGGVTLPLGVALMCLAVVLQIIGACWIYRIISIKV